MNIIQGLLFLLQICLLFPVAYLLGLTAAAWVATLRNQREITSAQHQFGILIPAHNEEKLLPHTLDSLQKLNYPQPSFDIHVIADNCTDRTAAIAQSYGVNVHIRQDTKLVGKGHALNWCYQELKRSGQVYDALVFIDADTTVSENFLQVMDGKLSQGAHAVQAYYAVKDPQMSWNTSLRYAALAVLHYLRPLGRMLLGGSAGLKGNGMVLTGEVLTEQFWSGSITEDIEAHMSLLLAGTSVKFAPGAVVWGEMPLTFEQSQTQLNRWEAGRLQMARKYVPQLLGAAARSLRRFELRKVYLYLDAALEHLIPPFTLLCAAAAACLGASGVIWLANILNGPKIGWVTWANLILALGLVFGQVLYLLSGLALVKAPPAIYRNLLYAPWFMLRKLGQLTGVLVHRGPSTWVKTPRNNG
jgi:cellulose synthase/poly-beta-1,6-N-acetylglucosamine synthase-like glycosyltransferase